MSAALKLWEVSPTRRGQRLLKIDQGLLTHSEEPLLGTVEIGDQRHDRREREDEREECQRPAGTSQSGMVSITDVPMIATKDRRLLAHHHHSAGI